MVQTYRPEPTAPTEWPDGRHRIRWIERVTLGTHSPAVVDRIAVVSEAAATWGHAVIVLDATGVGRPDVDMLKRRTSVPLRAVTFTSGSDEAHPSYNVHRVPKVDLVTSLEVVLQTRRIEVVPDCPLQHELAAELSAFDFALSAHGRASFEAASGSHDDLVLALCLAVWWGDKPSSLEAWNEAQRRRLADVAEPVHSGGGVR